MSTRLDPIEHAVDMLDVLDRAAYARQLGLVRARLGRSDAALEAFERSERLRREALGEHDPRTQLAMLARARMLAWRSDEASRRDMAQSRRASDARPTTHR
ncbi:MAG: hypothetical protein NVV68_04115 [Dokdonella sp.]|nr:hypothetical protein [Dokdonella sp.]